MAISDIEFTELVTLMDESQFKQYKFDTFGLDRSCIQNFIFDKFQTYALRITASADIDRNSVQKLLYVVLLYDIPNMVCLN